MSKIKVLQYLLISLSLTLGSCQNHKLTAEKQLKQLNEKEKNLFGNINQMNVSLPVIDPKSLMNLAADYEKFAYGFPEDVQSPGMLAKAANLYAAPSLKQYDKAFAIYDRLAEKYPTHKETERGAFMRGFIYNNELKQPEKAKTAYENFLKKYPKSELVPSVNAELQFLGTKTEELPFLKNK